MTITPRPKCSTCGQPLSRGASISGQKKFFCINRTCPERFKTVNDRSPTTSADSPETIE